MSVLPPWTLSARLEGEVLEFSLGDGRRLAWRARTEAIRLRTAASPTSTASFLGAELAGRLQQSAVRVLHIQYSEELEHVAWEQLQLGARQLGECFALARQPISAVESTSTLEASEADDLADGLGVALIHADTPPTLPHARQIALADLSKEEARLAALAAHVLILQAVTPDQLIALAIAPRHPSLWVLRDTPPLRQRLAALDAGAAVLLLDREADLAGTSLNYLLQQLAAGIAVGESVRRLRRDTANARSPVVRLYGDPSLCFVRTAEPTSRRQVTSLSFDLVGSTTLLRQKGDEAYAELLSNLHARCTEVVRRLGGQPDDPQGNDGVMCYFGHPLALEDAAVRAVDAGLSIVAKVAELGVSVRVGIATGLVAIKAGQPVGLSIHLAARLQQTAEPGSVLTAEPTRRLVSHVFELTALPNPPKLKGIDGLQGCYRVVGRGVGTRAHDSKFDESLTPLIGRERELTRLRQAWRQVRSGECHLAVVCAEAGMGKSRLVKEFRHRLVEDGVKVLESRCRADASASPYLTLAEALRRWLDISPATAAEDALLRLTAALPEQARRATSLGVLASFLGLGPQPALDTPGSYRQRLLGLLLEWFVVFAKDQPCCLIVEDWHWVDPSMREFVEHIAQKKGGPGLLVVITIRGDVAPAPLTFDTSEVIDLAGLSELEGRELVGCICAGRSLPADVLRTLVARGDGVPLFLEEAARMAIDLDPGQAGEYPRAEGAVPASLQDLLMARLDRLGSAKHLAQVAAVIGREFPTELLAALMEGHAMAPQAATLAEQTAALLSSGLVRSEGPGRLAFKHALIRDAAYASLWTKDRQLLHARVVHLLQQRWPEQVDAQPELLAQHQTEAGLYREALAQWELAANRAASRSAELEAINHLRRALSILPRTEPGIEQDRAALRLHLLLASRLIATEGYGAEAVLLAYREAERLGTGLGDVSAEFKVEMGLEAYRFMRADFGQALDHGQRAAAMAKRTGDLKQKMHAHWGLACTLFHQGKLRATMREMESALALYSPALHTKFGIQDPGVMCMAYSSWGLWEMARPDSALARINQAIDLAHEVNHKFSQAVALAYGVSIQLLRGESDEAFSRAERCIRVCEESGFPVWLAITRCMRGRILCERGLYDEGIREMRAGYSQWLATGALVSQPLYLALQAEGLMLAGQLDEAAACVSQGLAITGHFGERQLEAELHRLGGEVALRLGDVDRAQSRLKTAYFLAMRQHKLGFALRAATPLARSWADTGHTDLARRLLVPLLARWREGRQTRDVKNAQSVCDSMPANA